MVPARISVSRRIRQYSGWTWWPLGGMETLGAKV